MIFIDEGIIKDLQIIIQEGMDDFWTANHIELVNRARDALMLRQLTEEDRKHLLEYWTHLS